MAWISDAPDPSTPQRAFETSPAGPLCESGNPPVRATAPGAAPPGEAGFTQELALLEANRCLRCGAPLDPAPCSAACPADLNVPRFLTALARGSWEEAAQAIFAENLLGASCASICPTEELCEGACVLSQRGERPIEIGRLERFATHLALQNPWATFRTRALTTGKRVTVIGAGPAGLVCAGELAGLGHAVRLLDVGGELGGRLRLGVALDRSGSSPLSDEMRGIIGLGVELYLDSRVDTPESLWQIESSSDAIYLGIGMGAWSQSVLTDNGTMMPPSREPRPEFLGWIEGLDMALGWPRVDAATGQTTNPKYFAPEAMLEAGGTILAAVRAGKHAARAIDRWLSAPEQVSACWPGNTAQPAPQHPSGPTAGPTGQDATQT